MSLRFGNFWRFNNWGFLSSLFKGQTKPCFFRVLLCTDKIEPHTIWKQKSTITHFLEASLLEETNLKMPDLYQTLSITIVDSYERRLFHKFSRKDRLVIFGTSGSLIHFKTNRYSKPWVTKSKRYTLWLILHHGQKNYIKGRENENKLWWKWQYVPSTFRVLLNILCTIPFLPLRAFSLSSHLNVPILTTLVVYPWPSFFWGTCLREFTSVA